MLKKFQFSLIQLLKFPKQKTPNIIEYSSIGSLAAKVLTKKKDIDKIQPYLDKLNESIKADDINNIALMGSYGSGKSTILKTFQDFHKNEFKFLNISLAAFNVKSDKIFPSPNPYDYESTITDERVERLLEVSIFQQIFYSVKSSKIPESRFKRIENVKDIKKFLYTLGFLVWLISTIIFIKFDYLEKFNPTYWNTSFDWDYLAILLFLVTFFGIGYISNLLFRGFKNSRINKVNIMGEIELGENLNKSVFNEHLEEIIYFFEKTKYDVVIFEDLDRLDAPNIFTKLREINILLNKKRKIKFVYAVGDSLFKDKKERVKFFEFIIPIIPFINSSNANDKLYDLIEEAGFKKNLFEREFVSDVITYIDDIDMRLLINIFHEFQLYYKVLNVQYIKKPEELFSIIIYKNIEPGDFNNLNNKTGNLYNLIANKRNYVLEITKDLKRNIKSLNKKIELIKEQIPKNIIQLRNLYIIEIQKILPENSFLLFSEIDLSDDNQFEEITNGKINYINFKTDYYKNINRSEEVFEFNFSTIENNIDKIGYKEKEKLVYENTSKNIDILHANILEIQKKLNEIESWDLKDIFANINPADYLTNFQNNLLIKNLIVNGYINENYLDYISLFHEGTISAHELTFERNVKAGNVSEFGFKLEKIEGLLERIDTRYFKREQILNNDLFNYIFKNKSEYKSHFESIIKLLSNEKENSLKFINQFISVENAQVGTLINALVINWPNFLYNIKEVTKYDNNTVKTYLKLILTYCPSVEILKYQSHDVLIKLLELNPILLESLYNNSKKQHTNIEEIIKKLNIKFESLENLKQNQNSLYAYAYKFNHYNISPENIGVILNVKQKKNTESVFYTKNYSVISNSGKEELINYIESNIDLYVTKVLQLFNTDLKDEERFLIKLLNNTAVKPANKSWIISKIHQPLSFLSEIEDESLYKTILEQNKINPSWENLLHAKEIENSNFDSIISFCNNIKNATKLSQQKISNEKNSDGKMPMVQLWKDILSSDILSLEAFNYYIKSGNIRIIYFPFESASVERLTIMIKFGLFAFENSIYDELEEHHSLGQLYMEENKPNLLNPESKFELNNEHYISILSSSQFAVKDINTIIDHNFQSNELGIKDFDDPKDELLNAIRDRLSIDKNLNIDKDTIFEILKKDYVDNNLIKILNNYFNDFDAAEIRSIIKNFDDPEYEKFLSKNSKESIKIDQSEENDEFIELMQAKNYITSKSRKTSKGYLIYKKKSETIFL